MRPTILNLGVSWSSQVSFSGRKINIRSSHESNHENATGAHAIGEPTGSDTADAGSDVGRDSHELRQVRVVFVAEIANNRGEEQRVAVQAGVHEDGDEHVHPDLPVLEGVPEILEVKLVGERRPIALETGNDLLPLGLRQELGRVGIVVHDLEGDEGDDDGEKSF